MQLPVLLCLVFSLAVSGSKMQMPSFVKVGDKVLIECKLDHDHHEVEHYKWYKDNQLFYLVHPQNDSANVVVQLPDVPFHESESKMDAVVLSPISEEAAGLYTCELKQQDRMVRMSGTLAVYPHKE